MNLKEAASQPKKHSFLEACFNVLIGFGVAVISNFIVLPAFGYMVSPADSFYIAGVFTVISIVRSYILRRAFNWFHIRRL
jgi:hypothetical protein